jgi:hypothetical protein
VSTTHFENLGGNDEGARPVLAQEFLEAVRSHLTAAEQAPVRQLIEPEIRSSKSDARKKSEARSPDGLPHMAIRDAPFPTNARSYISVFGFRLSFGFRGFGFRNSG